VVGNLFGECPIDGCRLIGPSFRLTMSDRSAKSLEARGMSDKAINAAAKMINGNGA